MEKSNKAYVNYAAVSNKSVEKENMEKLFLKYEMVHKKCLLYFERLSLYEAEKIKKKDSVRLERIKMPTFNGDVRTYARFKSDFKKQVEPQLELNDLAYTLKSCLSEEALHIVESVDNDVSMMWKRLDDRYGRPSLLVDVIMNDIKKIQKIDDWLFH